MTTPLIGTTADRAAALAERCAQATAHGESWQACCPAHEDAHPSLSITAGTGKVLLKCHAGCPTTAIVAALGLTMSDLFLEQPASNGHKQIVKVYDYCDAHGTLVHQTVRYAPKDFKQRRPDPAHPGKYLWSLKGIEPVLYNLPAVLAAIRAGELVHLAEGEKDAETLRALGLVGTTVPMGAKYWRPSYTATLTGAHVVVWPDNDDAGQAGRTKVQRQLTGKAQTLRIVHVPAPHKDVSDWVQAGGTRTELEALVEAAPPPPPLPDTSEPTSIGKEPPPAVDPAARLGTVSPCTHVANAKRLLARYQPTLRYVLGLGWILWTGQFWRPDPTKDDALATGFVSGLALTIAEEAATLFTAAAQAATADERKALYALALERGKWAVLSEGRGTIAGGLALAKHAFLLDHEQINPNPWLFNCQNGTVDLKTGQRQPHDPADLITHLAPVRYDPTATCPTFTTFLGAVFAEDQSMVDFVQRAIGSSLTGVVQDRALFLLYGAQGHNGKTTLVEIVRDLLGTSGEEGFGYARKVDVMTFMTSKNYEDNLRKAAQLAGARFVYSSEIDEEHRLNEQLIKDMTGGDTMEARRLYKEAFNFKPTFKPWMYGNHKPEIRGTDDALWSRPKLIEFPVSFADRVDTELPRKLRAEMSGILNWAIAGCLAWQREGLNPPPKVQMATALYRHEQDVIGQFISECCQTGVDEMQCKASALYSAYRGWAEVSEQPVLSQKRFGAYLTAHGYPSDDNATGRGIFRRKIDLNAPPDDTEDDDDDEPAHLPANLRQERLAAMKANNGAVKTHSDPSLANLPNLTLEKSRERDFLAGFPETKVSKVSNSPKDDTYVVESKGDTVANLPNSKVSNPGAARGAAAGVVSPSYCPGCGRNSTWLRRDGREVCYKCGTQKPPRLEG